MSDHQNPGVSVFICRNVIPKGEHFRPRQWTQDGVHVRVNELPCSGKTDTQYLFHAMEGGARGLLVVTCPAGECQLSQGNYRAETRVRTTQRLLAEIGMNPERVVLLHCGPQDDLNELVRDAVSRLCALSESEVVAVGQ